MALWVLLTQAQQGGGEASIPSIEEINMYVFLKRKVALIAAWLYR